MLCHDVDDNFKRIFRETREAWFDFLIKKEKSQSDSQQNPIIPERKIMKVVLDDGFVGHVNLLKNLTDLGINCYIDGYPQIFFCLPSFGIPVDVDEEGRFWACSTTCDSNFVLTALNPEFVLNEADKFYHATVDRCVSVNQSNEDERIDSDKENCEKSGKNESEPEAKKVKHEDS